MNHSYFGLAALAAGWIAATSALHAVDLTKIPGVKAEEGRTGFVFSNTAAVVIKEPIVLAHEVSSVCSFVIENGPQADDVTFQAGLREAGGACGFAKSGPGTLRVEGDVSLGGVITLYEGTLDLSRARLAPNARINVWGNARLIAPIAKGKIDLYRNGLKVDQGSRRDLWPTLKYGIFSHYVWNGYGMTAFAPSEDGQVSPDIDHFANAFDVDHYVDQLIAMKAQYVVFTAWHSGTCPLFPSKAMQKWAPGRRSCPQRDLLGDLLDACKKRGIPAMFYCHPYQPVAEPHNDWINDLFAELIDRYGDRLYGLWLDENFQDCTQDKVVDYPRLMRTIKERNPDLVITHNNGGGQTYGSDEGVQEVQWESREGRAASVYQIFLQTAHSPENMLITTVIQAATNTMGGGIQWSIDAHGGGSGKRGGLDLRCRPILNGFVKLYAPIADSVNGTRSSTSYLPPYRGVVARFDDLTWGVALRSADDRKEFLHVLKAPQGNTLQLPPPADGKVFGHAKLLVSGKPLAMKQTNRGITLTLPEGESWQNPDTVIVMDVVAPGGVGLVNNTSRNIRFQGQSWKYERVPTRQEYRADRHSTVTDGDQIDFSFEGTDVAWLASPDQSDARAEVLLDNQSLGVIDIKAQPGTRELFAKSNLKRGRHTLRLIKRGGAMLSVDAFRVSDLVNDGDADATFSDVTQHGARSANLEGPWEPRGNSWINGQKFTFTFHGTEIEVQGGSAHGSGDLVLTLDGKEQGTAQCHGGQSTRTLFHLKGLSNQIHTIVGHYTNPHPAGFIPALDGFVVKRDGSWKHSTKLRGGELAQDTHDTVLKNTTGFLRFYGSGIESLPKRDPESRGVHYVLETPHFNLWQGVHHYAPVPIVGTPVYHMKNLPPGEHTLHFTNSANSSGVNFSQVRLTMDAFRVHKGESSSASPLFWGNNANGGSGEWTSGDSLAWFDGATAVDWQDFGANDYCAVFSGKAGEVVLKNPMRVNRIEFPVDGYTLRGEPLHMVGYRPVLHLGSGVKVTASCPIHSPDGTKLPPGEYRSSNHPTWITGPGVLIVTE